MTDEPFESPGALRQAWIDLRERERGVRTRSAAALGVSEAELLATRCGDGVRRIEADVEEILPRLEGLGTLMALTRNDLFVHEKTGVYRNVYTHPHVSSVLGEDIDLRIFSGRWVHGFAVERDGSRSRRRSLQFYDAHGVAVHKAFLQEGADVGAYETLVEELLADDQGREVEVEAPEASPAERPDDEVDVAALEADWRAIEDTHDFLGLLREHGVGRTQALRVVSDDLARPAGSVALRTVLEGASAGEIELMVFVRSPGTIQIHHGPVKRIVDTPPWLNVLDGDFDLHAREEDVAGSWVVRKPVEEGWVTSLELYDEAGTLCALIFGCREEGEPEDAAWRELVRGLPRPAGDR